jgi:hypothetical protein
MGWMASKRHLQKCIGCNQGKEVIDMGYHSLLPIDKLWLIENANSRESILSVQFSKEEEY